MLGRQCMRQWHLLAHICSGHGVGHKLLYEAVRAVRQRDPLSDMAGRRGIVNDGRTRRLTPPPSDHGTIDISRSSVSVVDMNGC